MQAVVDAVEVVVVVKMDKIAEAIVATYCRASGTRGWNGGPPRISCGRSDVAPTEHSNVVQDLAEQPRAVTESGWCTQDSEEELDFFRVHLVKSKLAARMTRKSEIEEGGLMQVWKTTAVVEHDEPTESPKRLPNVPGYAIQGTSIIMQVRGASVVAQQ